MSTEDNKNLIRRFYENVWDGGLTDFAYEVFADDYATTSARQKRYPAPRDGRRLPMTFAPRFLISSSRSISSSAKRTLSLVAGPHPGDPG